MSPLKIYKNDYADATIIANLFIDDYMSDANDAQLKVYLYLIRMMSANLSFSISDLADQFNHTEKDIVRALRYWEKKKIMTLECDENKNIVGIYIQDLSKRPTVSLPAKEAESPAPTTSVSLPAKGAESSAPTTSVSMAVQKPSFPKPQYSADDVRLSKDNKDFAQILSVAEQYLAKPLSVADMKSILFIYDILEFSTDLIDYLIEYCVGKGKREMRYIEKVAVNWAEEDISTVKQAKLRSNKYDKIVYAVMKALGRSSEPTDREASFVRKWANEYGFSHDVILNSCEIAALAVDKNRFQYTDGILVRWRAANVKTREDVLVLERNFQKGRAVSERKQGADKFTGFKQNAYDFASLERELIRN